jgi:D-xylose transport system ATP-binding protein
MMAEARITTNNQKPPMHPALRVVGAVKRFGAVLAVDNVSLSANAGEVLALLGDNGAGKSTLIKCISGVHRLDAGTVEVDGVAAEVHIPSDARQAGIETVYQDLALFDNMDATANFYAGRELSGPKWLPRGLQRLDNRQMQKETLELIERLKVVLPSFDAHIGLMSGGQRQAVAVARAAAFARKIVILDEPTAALGIRESRQVMSLVERLRDDGNAVVLITHNMEQVIEYADRVVVMRRGRKVGEVKPSEATHKDIVSMIVGG